MKFFKQLLASFALLMLSTSVLAIKTTVTFIHTDHLGSPVLATKEDGSVKWREDYQPFGKQLVNQDSNNSVGFTGHRDDKSLGLTYMQARWYNPEIGRFYSLDPILFRDVHSFNRYGYVANNPYKFIDPTGADLVLVGQGGDSGSLFDLAAKTWVSENPGKHQIVNVSTGSEAIKAMEDYASVNDGIDGLQVFSHSGKDGLYFNMSGDYASLYSSGAGWWYSLVKSDAASLGDIKSSWFKKDATAKFWGCKTAQGENSFASEFTESLGVSSTGSQSGNSFSGVKNGKPGQGLPAIIPANHSPIYLVPESDGWRSYDK